MTKEHGISNNLWLIEEGRHVADAILAEYLRVPIFNGVRVDTPATFDRAVARLAAHLRIKSHAPEQQALEAALEALDVDWQSISAGRRAAVILEATQRVERHLGALVAAVGTTLLVAATATAESTRASVLENGLKVGANLSDFDRRTAKIAARYESIFVRDACGRRAAKFGRTARMVVAEGLDQGRGRVSVAANLAAAARQTLISRSGPYWEVVAGSLIGQARSFAQIGAYIEAGVKTYRIEAVMDEVTSMTCRAMHGRTFQVADAAKFVEEGRSLKTMAALKARAPWGPAALAATVSLPPYHGLCRTTVIPV